MKTTKRRFECLSFYNHTGIEQHLTKMAERGWMIQRITSLGWVYETCPPKKICFTVTYFPKASEFDPEPMESQQTFNEFCAHTGWQLACISAQMQIFYNERENPVPINTDPVLEVENIHQACKKSFLPVYFFLLLLAVVNNWMFISRLVNDPVGVLSSSTNLFTGQCWILLFLLCIVELYTYYSWHGKAVKAAEQGEFLATPSYAGFQQFMLLVLAMELICWLMNFAFNGEILMGWIAISILAVMLLIILLVNGIKQWLKYKKAPRGVNRALTIAASFLLSFILMGAITYGGIMAMQQGIFHSSLETYEYQGVRFTIYQDELPLTVEDLLKMEDDGYIRQQYSNQSPLVAQFHMIQYPRHDIENAQKMPGLNYTITEIKVPAFYELCKKGLLGDKQDEYVDRDVVFINHYEPIDTTPWNAVEAYQLHWSDAVLNHYLLCYENRIIEISFDWEPTAEQMAIVTEKLNAQEKSVIDVAI